MVRERFDNMLRYASEESECRSEVLERYFGVEDSQPCGVCDICLARKRRDTKRDVSAEVEGALRAGALSVREVVAALRCKPEDVTSTVSAMLADGRLTMGDDGRLRLVAPRN